jgi:hypothetical protein
MKTITQEEFQSILDNHALWLEDKTKGNRADLSYCNLSGIYLADMDLRYVDFNHSILDYTTFCNSHLEHANFGFSSLKNTRFTDAHAEYAIFAKAELDYANFVRTHVEHADFRGASVENVNFSGAYFEETDLDFTCLPLACRGTHWHIDKRLAAQLAYHFCSMESTDMQVIAAQNALIGLANESHLIGDHHLDKLEQKSIDDINGQA